MALQIPPRLLGTVVKLFELPSPDRQALLDAMLEVTPSIGAANYEVHLREKFSDYAPESVSGFVSFFLSFYNLNEAGVASETIARDFVEALRDIDSEAIETASPEEFTEFEAFTARILNSHDSLGTSAKATRLILDNERTFVESEILSDIRSIFSDDDVVRSPSAAVIIHSLKIHYQDSSEHKDFFVVLDYGDLIKLQETIERALYKHKVLSDMVNGFGLHTVEVGGFGE